MKIFLSKHCHFRFLRVFLKSKKVNFENNFYYEFYISRNNIQYCVLKRAERNYLLVMALSFFFIIVLQKKRDEMYSLFRNFISQK